MFPETTSPSQSTPSYSVLSQMTSNAKRKQHDATDGWGPGAPSLGESHL